MAMPVAQVVTAVSNKEEYQEKLYNIPYTEYQLQMKDYAEKNEVPIIQDEGLAFLLAMISVVRPIRILEIGAAIGYSSSFMALNSKAIIDTIERDPKMIEECKKNHKALGLENRINLIEGDALKTFDNVKDNTYDFIFIDAAKAQYTRFFELYSPLLSERGLILSDNLYFHDQLFIPIKEQGLKGLCRKINRYNNFLMDNPNFETHIFKIGDGIGISTRKSK